MPRPSVRCQGCRKVVFDGLVVRARVVRVLPSGQAEAKCHCKRWLLVPLRYG